MPPGSPSAGAQGRPQWTDSTGQCQKAGQQEARHMCHWLRRGTALRRRAGASSSLQELEPCAQQQLWDAPWVPCRSIAA